MNTIAIAARTRSLAIMIRLRSMPIEQHARNRSRRHAGIARAIKTPATTSPEPVFASARLNTAMLLKLSPTSLTTCPDHVKR